MTTIAVLRMEVPANGRGCLLFFAVFIPLGEYRALAIPRRLLPAFVLSGAAFEFTSALVQSLVKAKAQAQEEQAKVKASYRAVCLSSYSDSPRGKVRTHV
jgi:hypothetical protein